MNVFFVVTTILKAVIGVTGLVYVILNLLKWFKVKQTPYPKDALKALLITWVTLLVITLIEYFIIKM
ncbi:hypothetical protein [Solitalea canadensis]|uniref:Uncharacterized protein n=1 Tax=Solitalea canadensis (strain ATCC 29591 / DSM 3403 / JCM 21819 / LMG 8368 / NBRC 15130 / NCIMB 12057 / USAM 9D) TaxID=929556 RepID=H8KQR4_SOLCM|nr:hypothetical protein [Solitalea canadensis]AFD06935.1 hypothetical protein Solca_1874 [Solitalea canadensis DSM 3403]